jgi:hypothetical protein
LEADSATFGTNSGWVNPGQPRRGNTVILRGKTSVPFNTSFSCSLLEVVAELKIRFSHSFSLSLSQIKKGASDY